MQGINRLTWLSICLDCEDSLDREKNKEDLISHAIRLYGWRGSLRNPILNNININIREIYIVRSAAHSPFILLVLPLELRGAAGRCFPVFHRKSVRWARATISRGGQTGNLIIMITVHHSRKEKEKTKDEQNYQGIEDWRYRCLKLPRHSP